MIAAAAVSEEALADIGRATIAAVERLQAGGDSKLVKKDLVTAIAKEVADVLLAQKLVEVRPSYLFLLLHLLALIVVVIPYLSTHKLTNAPSSSFTQEDEEDQAAVTKAAESSVSLGLYPPHTHTHTCTHGMFLWRRVPFNTHALFAFYSSANHRLLVDIRQHPLLFSTQQDESSEDSNSDDSSENEDDEDDEEVAAPAKEAAAAAPAAAVDSDDEEGSDDDSSSDDSSEADSDDSDDDDEKEEVVADAGSKRKADKAPEVTKAEEPVAKKAKKTEEVEDGDSDVADHSVFIGGIAWGGEESSLQEYLSSLGVGKVTSVRIMMDRETGRSKGFGYADCSAKTQAALCALTDAEYLGRTLRFDFSEQKKR